VRAQKDVENRLNCDLIRRKVGKIRKRRYTVMTVFKDGRAGYYNNSKKKFMLAEKEVVVVTV
jgi:hypothetical protein